MLTRFAALLLVSAGMARPCAAQRVDTARAAADTGVPAEQRPPISPRRAFVSSLLVPGFAQSVLGRPRSGALFLAFEAVAFVMIRESALGVREARRNAPDSIATDSILVSHVDANGAPGARYERTPFPRSLIRSRKEQVEDWVAVLVANHLFAATDGFVGALLWDLPAEVALSGTRRSAELALRFRW